MDTKKGFQQTLEEIEKYSIKVKILLQKMRNIFCFSGNPNARVFNDESPWQGLEKICMNEVFKPYIEVHKQDEGVFEFTSGGCFSVHFVLPGELKISYWYEFDTDENLCFAFHNTKIYTEGSLVDKLSKDFKIMEIFPEQSNKEYFSENEFIKKLEVFGENTIYFKSAFSDENELIKKEMEIQRVRRLFE